MKNKINNKILYLIPLFFAIVLFYRVGYNYADIVKREYNFAKTEASILNKHVIENRNYYQKLFINHTIKLNEETLLALPAYSSSLISESFTQKNNLGVEIRTVSDRARNAKNSANSSEIKAIKFFSSNPKSTEYFDETDNNYYQYASALRIRPVCLKCHGKKESAPAFIQKRYPNAYDYKLGEVRGIISITIPKERVKEYFYHDFLYATLYDIILFVLLFIVVYYFVKQTKSINDSLEEEVLSKTNEIRYTLVMDRLTLLPNRLQLIEDLQKNLTKEKYKVLILLDIDKFKDINDFYGAAFGDKVLQSVASTISSLCTNNKATLYKLPSDEYAIYIDESLEKNLILEKIQTIIKSTQETQYLIDQNSIYVTLSCGVAFESNDILTKADMALRYAKENKKSLIIYNNSLDMSAKIDENNKGLSLLKDAFSRDAVIPFFQPIYNVKSKKIEKYESLVRIVNDDEIIAPYKFLDIAVKSKLYPRITKIMIEKTFEFFKESSYEFSINLSINDITDAKTSKFIFEKLKEFNEPERIVFELLETDRVENYEQLKEFIKELKKYGVKVAIDDFGSGYSNFSHILELHIDYLKIDASLVKYITTDENSKKITNTIINFASDLGVKTIAEYVEDKESLELLTQMGVDYIQGYYIGKPQATLQEV